MATPTPSEKLWKVAPTRCLPNQSILTCFATKSTAGWQAPRDRQLPCDVRLGSKCEILSPSKCFPVCPRTRTWLDAVGTSHLCHLRTLALQPPCRPDAGNGGGGPGGDNGRSSPSDDYCITEDH